MFLLNKIVSFHAEQTCRLEKYEPALANHGFVGSVILETITIDESTSSHRLTLHDNTKVTEPSFLSLSLCYFYFNTETRTISVDYMETAEKKRQSGLQQLLHAIIYDHFDIKEVIFENVQPNGKNFIYNCELFLDLENIGQKNKSPDIKCIVNKNGYKQVLKRINYY